MKTEDSIFSVEDSTTNDGNFGGTAMQSHEPTSLIQSSFAPTVKVDDILCLLESEREARRLR
jgi:hypothetical protein